MSTLKMNEINLMLLFLLLLRFPSIVSTQGQLCTLQFLPALQIINMAEDTPIGNLVARLQISGTSSEISTRLVYNSSEVKTNGSEYFTLNFINLYLRYSLDYEWWMENNNPNPFRFIVECTILSNQSKHNIDFQLDLIDINDNSPVFYQNFTQINLTENTPVNTIIPVNISAYDRDTVSSGIIYYLLNSSNYTSYFQVKNTSLILSKPLDYNSMPSKFNITIVAQDRGNPPLSTIRNLLIHLIDIDNLNPIFSSPSYNLNISIETPTGFNPIPSQGLISAFDQDFGINASIIYSIITPNIYFLINSTTGVLTLRTEFNSTMQFNLTIKAEQADNINRSTTTILTVTIFEINLYPPSFINTSYRLIGYTTYNSIDQIPIFNGSVIDNDTTPRLTYGYSCNSSQLTLNIEKTSLRNFQIRPSYFQINSSCYPCLCILNVSDGFYSSQTILTVFLYKSISFVTNAYRFSANYPLNDPSLIIGNIEVNSDTNCLVQYSLQGSSSSLFSISRQGNLTWTNPSNPPIQQIYELTVIGQQNCSLIIMSISTSVIITISNFPSLPIVSTTSSTRIENSTIYAIIGAVGGFILIVIAVLFIIIYYQIQRAKHRVPPFFKSAKHSPAQGLAFFKSKSPLGDLSPYTLGVRDDDSSNGGSEQTSSSPINNRLLSGHYKVNELPMNTTIEELLSAYDNRSTSSSSSSSGRGDQMIANNTGSFRTTVRETIDHPQLDTINEDMQWMNHNHHHQQQQQQKPRHLLIPEDAMDIISESHESSISGIGNDVGVSTLLQPQSNTRDVFSRNLNEYLTVFV